MINNLTDLTNNYFLDINIDLYATVKIYDLHHTFIGSFVSLDTDTQSIYITAIDFVNDIENNLSYNKNYLINSFTDIYEFLDNHFTCNIQYDGLIYRNVQSAFEAQKEKNKMSKIRYTTIDGYTAEKISPQVKPSWNDFHIGLMTTLIRLKFTDTELATKLIQTYPKHIEYTNSWHDNFWGMCTCENCTEKNTNYLGQILELVRSELIEAEKD